MSSPEDMGTGWRGAFGSFMIISSTLLKSDWSKFSIWNGVMGSQPIRMKHSPGEVQEQSGNSPGAVQEESGKSLGAVWEESRSSPGIVQEESRKSPGAVWE